MHKFLLYAHDGVGYGHIARMANLAESIAMHLEKTVIHFVSGFENIDTFFKTPIDINHIKLPSLLRKNTAGRLPENSLLKLNKQERILKWNSIFSLNEYDYIIIDFFPFGTRNELKDILKQVKYTHPKTKIILIQRGIVFSKKETFDFFDQEIGLNYINETYNKIICLCDSRVVNMNQEYFENKVTIPIKYCGYLYQKNRFLLKARKDNQFNILIDFGGGHNCDDILIDTIDKLVSCIDKNYSITILWGEYFKIDTFKIINQKCTYYSNIQVLKRFERDIIFNLYSNIIIGCGGYNVTIDAIFNNVPLIVIPKDAGEEADLHTSRIAKYSTIKILHHSDIDLLWDTIQSQINKDHIHSLSSCDEILLSELLND